MFISSIYKCILKIKPLKMIKAIIIVVFIPSFFITVFARGKCYGENMYWTDCIPPCTANCSSPNPPQNCADEPCRSGCTCVEGYFMNSRWECIAKEQCETCISEGPLHEYTNCGSNCPPCHNPNEPCTRDCKAGCVCIAGYLENTLGQCIKRKNCETCGENQEYREGVSGCAPNCLEPNPPICPTLVRQDECYCLEGFVRNCNNTCVSYEQCIKENDCGL